MPSLFQAAQNTIRNLRPLQTVSSFVNNETANVKTDPGVQSRMAAAAPQPVQVQQQAFQSKLNELNSWSKSQTQMARATAMNRRAQEAASRIQPAAISGAKKTGFTRLSNEVQGKVGNVDPKTWSTGSNSEVRNKIVSKAMSLLGTPYAWGGGNSAGQLGRGTGKGTQNVIGVDCSGLTSIAYGSIGVKLPRYSGNQTASGVKTSIQNAQPGDIVGWQKGGHVAIYIGNGMIVESPKPGAHVRTRRLGAGERAYAVRLRLPGE